MTVLKLGPFAGLAPRTARARTSNQYADSVVDFDLSGDTLRPLRDPRMVAETATGNGYFCGCDWVDLPYCALHVEHIGVCTTDIISGDGEPTIGKCPGARCLLRVEAPDAPPIVDVTVIADADRDTVATHYAYTFITSSGNETGISYPSPAVRHAQDATVTLTGFETRPAEECIDKIRIYRTMTAYRSGTEEQREALTGWVEVAEFDVGTVVASFAVSDLDAGSAISYPVRSPAPAGLRYVHSFGGRGGLIGYTRREVRQSVPINDQWWPLESSVMLSKDISALAVHRSFAVAFTEEGLFLIRPVGADRQCTDPLFIAGAPTSMIQGDNAKWTATKNSIMYVSDQGIIEVLPDGQFRNVTIQWFAIHDWRLLRPDTIVCGYAPEHLLFSSHKYSYMINYEAPRQEQQLVSITDLPTRYFNAPTGEVLIASNGLIGQWNQGDVRTGTWTKTITTTPMRFRFVRASLLGAGSITINGASTLIAGHGKNAKLATYRRTREHRIHIASDVEVSKINIATSTGELTHADF